MPLFLNTPKLNEWLPKLIATSEKELVLVVPYIKISKPIFKALKKADKNGVAITIVYRENKLSNVQKEKILELNKLNLLHHPNIHCKCYYNGTLLIIGSMNLYEYSEENNREMGVLFYNEYFESPENSFQLDYDDPEVFYDTIFELCDIVKSGTLERVNSYYKTNGFEIDILKTNKELTEENCRLLNNYFLNKKFIPLKVSDYDYTCYCENYYDNIHIVFEYMRIKIEFDLSTAQRKELYEIWDAGKDEINFDGYKYYWNYFKSDLLLYSNNRKEAEEMSKQERIKHFKKGIDLIIKKYRKLTGK
ncbi:phospholipase D family protein [Marixanthomonas sp. SCSIO 43207]|uniref:phospholipase D family protein n=1 Tax=Marixanthomonas sp. SCSIO 43207 TaxID=2779360 RepID=UPI001CA920D1|nr:phospholipase D family protein [Marixanthomonas sp. SCSIO 43207]UAB80959.1 phospholipase D family protein [Marixanthomonas sp. SCSIO 43207]